MVKKNADIKYTLKIEYIKKSRQSKLMIFLNRLTI